MVVTYYIDGCKPAVPLPKLLAGNRGEDECVGIWKIDLLLARHCLVSKSLESKMKRSNQRVELLLWATHWVRSSYPD